MFPEVQLTELFRNIGIWMLLIIALQFRQKCLRHLNEAVILKALKEEKENKTVVLVSHRKSTMCIAQKVYSVEHGRVS